jgi:hypothetical protein
LTSVSQNGTTLASYAYATNGTRTSATEGGVTTNFLLDGRTCVSEIPAAGGTPTPTLFGPTGPISRGTQWFSPDASGSIAAVTDNTGLEVAQNCYGLFGQVATTNPNSGDPLQFLGGMNDPTTGLNYLGGGGAWSANLGQGLGSDLASVASLAPGSFPAKAGQYYLGLIDCGLQQLRPFAEMLDPELLAGDALQQATGVLSSVRQVGVVGTLKAALNGLIHTYTAWLHPSEDPRAAGRSLCNTVAVVVTFVGGAAGGGGGGGPLQPGEDLGPIMGNTGLIPTQTEVSAGRINGFVQDMLGGNWDWSRVTAQNPLILGPDGEIMAGHHRFIAAELAGVDIPESVITHASKNLRPTYSWSEVKVVQ